MTGQREKTAGTGPDGESRSGTAKAKPDGGSGIGQRGRKQTAEAGTDGKNGNKRTSGTGNECKKRATGEGTAARYGRRKIHCLRPLVCDSVKMV